MRGDLRVGDPGAQPLARARDRDAERVLVEVVDRRGALAELPVTLLAKEDDGLASRSQGDDVLPRPEARRRRLSARRSAAQYGEDCWLGVEQWQELEGRVN